MNLLSTPFKCAALALLLATAAAAAQSVTQRAAAAEAAAPADVHAGMVSVGEVYKPSRARVTAAVAGDVACYLSLTDAQGQTFEEMAAFEVCEQEADIVNQEVDLEWTVENVMADSCQGNPDCAESQSVPLIRAVQRLPQ